MSEMRDKPETPETKRDERRESDRRQMTREPLRENPEVMEREQMRSNPEVMGRREPVNDLPDRPGRVGGPGEQRMDIWPDMTGFHQRFDQLQSDFIEEPREAVKKAERLIVEMLDNVTKTMKERMQNMHREGDGKQGDTEQLRVTMQRYKEFIRSFGRREAV